MKVRLKYYKLRLLSALVFGFVSCTEIIDIELDSTYRRLVVYGSITTDSLHHQVQLSTSSDYFSNIPSPKIKDAVVEVEYGNTLLQLVEHDTMPGLSLAPQAFRGVPNTTYRLHIRQVDVDEDGIFETYNAESTIPPGAQLDSIRLTYFLSPFVSGYQVFMYAHDPPTI